MRRLLAYKGYIFPELKKEDAAVLNPSDNLKSIEEIQKEEKIAQSAKLQELIRRGRPQDLKEANKLMKIMSGFKDEEMLEATKAKVAEDVDKLKRKVEIFEEMINNATNVGKIDSDDSTINDLYYSLKVAQPKIQKIIEEENDDAESVTSLLALNDNINNLINQYITLKGGEPLPTSTSSGNNAMNLIDFDDDDYDSTPTQAGAPKDQTASSSGGGDLVDLLSDLNFSPNGTSQQPLFGLGGSIALESSPPPADAFASFSNPSNTNTTNNNNSTSFGGLLNKPEAPAPQQANQQALDPFQFDFNSLSTPSPAPAAPTQGNKILVNESQYLKFEFEKISQSDSKVSLKSLYSTVSLNAISSLQIMLAVPKTWDLQLLPQSGNYINGLTTNGITQFVNLTKKAESNKAVKIKWKINYVVSGNNVEESGVVAI